MELITSHEITANIKGDPKVVFSSYNLTLKEMKSEKRKRARKLLNIYVMGQVMGQVDKKTVS